MAFNGGGTGGVGKGGGGGGLVWRETLKRKKGELRQVCVGVARRGSDESHERKNVMSSR